VRLWDLLVATIPHRHKTLCELLADLDAQIAEAGATGLAGAVLYRDNLSQSYGDKTGALLQASRARYVSCIDDDDLLAPGAMRRVLDALQQEEPDYVGFAVEWTRDGEPGLPVEHSLRHPRWENGEDMLVRSVMQFNPIRRELALDGRWEGGYGAEKDWGDGVIAAGHCRKESWLPPPPVYRYRECTADTFKTERQPVPADQIAPLPGYPWLTVLHAQGSC
jgi:hypothetical protein